jgi:hypothetical protein
MKDPRRPLLIGGIALIAACAVLYALGMLPAVRPWLLLAGGLAVVLYFILARAARRPVGRHADSMLFEDDRSTTMELRDRDGNPGA